MRLGACAWSQQICAVSSAWTRRHTMTRTFLLSLTVATMLLASGGFAFAGCHLAPYKNYPCSSGTYNQAETLASSVTKKGPDGQPTEISADKPKRANQAETIATSIRKKDTDGRR
jgi:hypothetical protein